MTASRCCNRPQLHRAYVPRRPFGKAVYCASCGDVRMDGAIASFLFENLLWPFWNGQVQVMDGELR